MAEVYPKTSPELEEKMRNASWMINGDELVGVIFGGELYNVSKQGRKYEDKLDRMVNDICEIKNTLKMLKRMEKKQK